MDFIDEENGTLLVEETIFLCPFNNFANILNPQFTAERVKKGASTLVAIILASVVLPTPGGPQKIHEEILPASIIRRRGCPSPMRCCCPI